MKEEQFIVAVDGSGKEVEVPLDSDRGKSLLADPTSDALRRLSAERVSRASQLSKLESKLKKPMEPSVETHTFDGSETTKQSTGSILTQLTETDRRGIKVAQLQVPKTVASVPDSGTVLFGGVKRPSNNSSGPLGGGTGGGQVIKRVNAIVQYDENTLLQYAAKGGLIGGAGGLPAEFISGGEIRRLHDFPTFQGQQKYSSKFEAANPREAAEAFLNKVDQGSSSKSSDCVYCSTSRS